MSNTTPVEQWYVVHLWDNCSNPKRAATVAVLACSPDRAEEVLRAHADIPGFEVSCGGALVAGDRRWVQLNGNVKVVGKP